MEEYMDTIELNQMKEQIAILNRRLNEEIVINKELLRKIVKNKVSSMNRYVWIMNSLALLLIPFYIWGCSWLGISWWFCGIFCLFMLVAIIYTYIIHSRLCVNDIMNEDLLGVAKKVIKLKASYSCWRKFSIPFIVILMCWFFIELQLVGRSNIISFGIGLVYSSWVAFKQYRKMQRTLDAIQQEINELLETV